VSNYWLWSIKFCLKLRISYSVYCKTPWVASTLGSATSRLHLPVELISLSEAASWKDDVGCVDFLFAVEVVTAREFAAVFVM
jgi:hypothetical protein